MAASMQYMRCDDTDADVSEDVLLASFKNGRLLVPSDTRISAHSPEFTFHRSVHASDSRKKNWRTLVGESNGLQYVGQNYGAEASRANSTCKYLVGVLDKKSNKMKVYDAQYLQLKPWLQKSSDVVNDETDSSEKKTYAEKQDALTQAFGSVRKRHAVENRRKSRVGTEALDESAKTAVKIATSQPTTPIKDTMDSVGVLPPCHRNATVVQDVYKLDEILMPHLQRCLQKPAQKLCNATAEQLKEWHTNKTYSPFILNHVKTLVNDTSDCKPRNGAIILYIHYLSLMHKLKVSELKKIPFEDDTPEVMKRHLKENFTQMVLVGDGASERRCLPKRMKDKILSHALVLALILDDYKASLTNLQTTLVVGIKVLQTHARALGCSVNTVKSTPKKVKDKDAPAGEQQQTSQSFALLSLPLKVARTFKKRAGRN